VGERRIGLVYDLLGTYPSAPGDPPDIDAEYEPEATLCLLERAFRVLGHVTLRLGNAHALLARCASEAPFGVDAVLSIAEGFGSRNREAWAPILLELRGVPCLGADALSLSASLDKAWASQRVAAAGVPVPWQRSLASAGEVESLAIPVAFPLFVKPRWEGTAKGIRATSVVADRAALAREALRVVRDYQQPALVEAFLPGPEYTVAVIGHAPPRALPVLQRALERDTRIGLHALERRTQGSEALRFDLPGELTRELETELQALALRAFEALECRDFARADFRLDARGRPHFLELNPLPTFAADGSFGILAELEGREPEQLLAEVFGAALARIGLT
jgi:D-alanine-D-alanine ligase